MTNKELLKFATKFLLSFENITKEDIDIHLVSESNKPRDLKKIFFRMCVSAQNRQMSNKVIGKSIGGVESLNSVLFKFNPKKVAKEYDRTERMKLLSAIKNSVNVSGKIRTESKSIWPQYCQSIIDSAHFLNSFKSADDFYNWAEFFEKDIRAKPGLPLMLSTEISGFGFPLACDFLKEIGFNGFGKPDVHLKRIFQGIGKLSSDIKSNTTLDYLTFKIIDDIARSCRTTSYAVDKIFWLIGSGRFYLTDKTIGRNRDLFIHEYLEANKG